MRPASCGEHLAGVCRAVGEVAAGPLVLGGGLGDRPDGERHGRRREGGVVGVVMGCAHDRRSVT